MKISEPTLKAIAHIITGEKKLSPYRSGYDLIHFFNPDIPNETYGQGFPSRWKYTEDQLRKLNQTQELAKIICKTLDPREFLGTDFDSQIACDYINDRLRYDGYEVVINNGITIIHDLKLNSIPFNNPFKDSKEDVHLFIDEQISKAEKKLKEADYDGAISNARSLLEAILKEIECQLNENPPEYDGDLPKLYKRVQKLLNLGPNRPDIDGSLKQVLSGFVSIINGLSSLSNRMGDRHVRSYKPAAHHAALVVNATKTLANFFFETLQFQSEKYDLVMTNPDKPV